MLTEPAGASASIPVVFAEQVARVPDAVAVSFEGRSMTYRELDEASNRLAHLLAGRGAGPGQRVALMFSRSVEAVVAILAVLKSGAAYVPIDPAHPDARVEFVLSDAAPIVAVTTTELAGGWRVGSWRSSTWTIRGSTANPAPHWWRRPPMTWLI